MTSDKEGVDTTVISMVNEMIVSKTWSMVIRVGESMGDGCETLSLTTDQL